MSSTFGSFTTVRLGIYAAQKGLDVTGNNITNINTTGYTRQRLDQVSLVTSAADRTYSPYKTRIGQGVLTTGVSQLRDPGLDLSYRNATSDVGAADAKLAGLQDIAQILDEVGKGDGEQDDGVLLNQMNDLRDLISQAMTNGIDTYNGLIRTSASSLCTLFNAAANSLQEKVDKYEDRLSDQVDTINNILTNLRDLNVAIRSADIRGDEALELRDQRNLLLDELSQYVEIDVQYSMEDVGAGLMVEKLSVSLGTVPGHYHTLVDGEYAGTISVGDSANNYEVTLHAPVNSAGIKMDPTAPDDLVLLDNDLYGAFQSTREMLTEEGEYASIADMDPTNGDPQANVKRGIPYYQKALDSLARTFAEAMNKINTEDVNGAALDPAKGAGALFSNSSNGDDTTDITAANISVSKSWAEDKVSVVASTLTGTDDPSGDTSNLARFLAAFDLDHAFDPKDIQNDAEGAVYNGTFEDMLLRIQSTLAEDEMNTTAVLTNYTITANEVYMDRDSVMGVDLNDEATSLMTYQKAYTAACRLMTVLEEALDSLINGTIV